VTEQRDSAIAAFNKAWELLETPDRTPAEDQQMLELACASRQHWLEAEEGTPLHHARGDWQIARVHSVLGDGSDARRHAERYAAFCRSDDVSAFDLAFSHEGLARACLVGGADLQDAMKHLEAARALAPSIEPDSDRTWLIENVDALEAILPGVQGDRT